MNSFANSTCQVKLLFLVTDIDLFSMLFNEMFSGMIIPLSGSSLREISTVFLSDVPHMVINGASLSS